MRLRLLMVTGIPPQVTTNKDKILYNDYYPICTLSIVASARKQSESHLIRLHSGSCRLGFQCIINRDCPAGHFCASNGQCLRNPCDPSPCGPGAVCSFNPNYFEPICQCAPGLILNCPFGDCEEQQPHITYRPTDFHWEDDHEIEGDAGCVECLEDRDCPDIWRRPQTCVDRHCVEAPQEFNNVSLHSNNEDASSQVRSNSIVNFELIREDADSKSRIFGKSS